MITLSGSHTLLVPMFFIAWKARMLVTSWLRAMSTLALMKSPALTVSLFDDCASIFSEMVFLILVSFMFVACCGTGLLLLGRRLCWPLLCRSVFLCL